MAAGQVTWEVGGTCLPHTATQKMGGQEPKAKAELTPTTGQEKKGGDAGQVESEARREAAGPHAGAGLRVGVPLASPGVRARVPRGR